MSQDLDVFVSSTSLDLTHHRAAVRDVITSFNLNPIMMDDFPAEDAKPVDVCRRTIAKSDILVGIYAHRYGWIPSVEEGGEGNLSITALEYQWAGSGDKPIPRLCFLVDPTYEWPDKYREGERGASLLAAFKHRVDGDVTRATFTTPADLASKVRSAISNTLGWRPPEPPPPSRRYIGRDDLLTTMRNALNSHNRVALTGIGGIGKTMTAAQIAQDMHKAFSGGVLWVRFGTEAPKPETLLHDTMRRWAEYHHPGRIMNPNDLKPEQVRYWLSKIAQDEPLLIVFDDIWQIDPPRVLMRLVPDCAKLLITTRHADIARQLDINKAQIHEIDRLSEMEGVALLRDRVGDIPSPIALRQIVSLLDGHPLALDVIAAQITENDPDYADELPDLLSKRLESNEGLELLRTEGDEARYANVEVALSLTYERLSQDLQHRFRALGVLAPDAAIPPPILSAVWADEVADPVGCSDSWSRMDALVSTGVLTKVNDFYNQHGLVRVYARARLDQSEREGFWQRYAKIVTERAKEGYQRPPQDWYALDPDMPHVHYVGDTLTNSVLVELGIVDMMSLALPMVSQDRPSEKKIATALLILGEDFGEAVRHYVLHRWVENGRVWMRMGLACSRLLEHRENERQFLGALGLWHRQRNYNEQALRYSLAGLRIDQMLGDRYNEATALNNIGGIYSLVGQKQRALDCFERSLLITRAIGDRTGEATALNNLGGEIYANGEVSKALETFEQALAITRQEGDRVGEGAALNNTALAHQSTGQLERALDRYKEALLISREVGDRYGTAATLNNVGAVYHDLGQQQQALASYEQALSIEREIGNRLGEATTLNNMSILYIREGKSERSVEMLYQIIQIHREVGAVEQEAASLFNLAVILNDSLARTSEAIPLVEQSIAIMEEHELTAVVGNLTLEQCRAFLAYMRSGAPAKPDNAQAIAEAIRAFVDTPNWSAALLVVEERADLLLRPEIDAMFGLLIANQADEEMIEELEIHRTLLASCREHGTTATLEEMQTRVIFAFVNAPDLNAAQAVVEDQADLLLRPNADAVFARIIAEQTDASAIEILEDRRAVLALCREYGVKPAFARIRRKETLVPDNPKEIFAAFIEFEQTPDWASAQALVEAQADLLLHPEADIVFGVLIDTAPDNAPPERLASYIFHRAVLARCREQGIAAAFEWARAQGSE